MIKKYYSLKNLYNISEDELLRNKQLSKIELYDLLNKEYKHNLIKYVEYMTKNKISIINYNDSKYPIKLKFIKNRPIVLYMKGNVENLNNESIGIVGSRNCTDYGRKAASYFAYELSKRKINIISGLAKGIDSIAHKSALKAKGKTIAVIGNGLDNIYPSENKKLACEILENDGLIISEYIIGTKPEKTNFPRRNRIISGISNAVIIIEASKISGSLITAEYAINQGKEVWVVPGSIYSNNSIGTNNLIKDGANVLTNISDIIL